MIRLQFLGWSEPPLRQTVAWLAERARQAQGDLAGTLVVLPTSLAKRRLEAELARVAVNEGWAYCPPEIMTVGLLPERLYLPRLPFADPTVQQWVWAEVLQCTPEDRLRRLLPVPPARDDHPAWCRLGEALATLRRELAADQLDCRRVLDRASKLPDFDEAERWEVLAELEQAYLNRLDELELWDKQAARLEAIRRNECHTDRQIVLAGTVDLRGTVRTMLEAVADHVTALVFAPADYRDRFDAYGCPIPEKWESESLPLEDRHLAVADDPDELAVVVTEAIRESIEAYEAEVTPRDVVVGVPDESFLPGMRRVLASAGARLRYGPGQPLSETSPAKLWRAMADWLASRAPEDLSELIRHPAVFSWLAQSAALPASWLARLDAYVQQWLPARLVLDEVRARKSEGCRDAAVVAKVLTALDRWLAPLSVSKPLAKWGSALTEVMEKLLHGRRFDSEAPEDRSWMTALRHLAQVRAGWEALPSELDREVPASEALEALLETCAQERVAEPPQEDAIEAHGWLELPWDDAPIVVVAGMNEGIIPQSVNADPFLPNRLRQALGLDDNRRRFVRDWLATRLLLESRPHVKLVAVRRNADGDPLLPSRLWFCQNPERQLEAVHRFLQGGGGLHASVSWLRGTGSSPTEPPRPSPLTQDQRRSLRRLRVTQFRDYLACPYRFYLRHVLKLEAVAEAAAELDSAQFGSLAHEVLRRFGESPVAASDDAGEIAKFLSAELDEVAAEQFGRQPVMAVRLQQELLRERLEEFAVHQAESVRQGWRIVACEYKGAEYAIPVDGAEVQVVGRIDRIDWHEADQRLRVLDYKTGDSGERPSQTHRSGRRGMQGWVDLQLPLYRHLLAPELLEVYPAREIELGYVLLPKNSAKGGFAMAAWKEEELIEADEVARSVAEAIVAETFWPPKDDVRYDDFEEICMEGMLV